MRITNVEALLLRGDQVYQASAGSDEALDNGDWQLLVHVATDEGLSKPKIDFQRGQTFSWPAFREQASKLLVTSAIV